MNKREKLWTISHDLIEGLGPHFGVWKGMAQGVAYDNIMGRPGSPPKLTDREIDSILVILLRDINA